MKPEQQMMLRLAENSDRILDAVTKVGVAYVGYKAVDHWSGALTGLVALKLANANNLAAGIAGVATLTGLGVMSTIKSNPYGGRPLTDAEKARFAKTDAERLSDFETQSQDWGWQNFFPQP